MPGGFISVGAHSPTDNKKDAHGFGKEICLIARDLNPARKSCGARLELSRRRPNGPAVTTITENKGEVAYENEDETLFEHPLEHHAGSTVESAVNDYYEESISTDAKTAVSDNKMFLLSIDEADTIHNANPNVLKCSQASYAFANIWWLCSQGYDYYYAAVVSGETGEVDDFGENISFEFDVKYDRIYNSAGGRCTTCRRFHQFDYTVFCW
ncbi:MAG: hypothetical protein K6F17_00845 [Lachnospiraceae bacterium]|nr:hypothetical protein [Lachnospiraceae bacterium]